MGKRKVTNEGNLDSMILPSKNDVLGMAVKMLGAERIMVKCQDVKERLCRVRGKLKRRVWIREATSFWFRHGTSRWKQGATYFGGTERTSQIGLETTITSQCDGGLKRLF